MKISDDLIKFALHDGLIEHLEISDDNLIFGIESPELRPDSQSRYGYLIFHDVEILEWEPKVLFEWSDSMDGEISVIEYRADEKKSDSKEGVICVFFLGTPESYKNKNTNTTVIVLNFLASSFEWKKK